MWSKLLPLALLSSSVLAAPQLEKREPAPQATNAAEFSSAVSQLVSLYLPTDIATAFAVVAQSAAAAEGTTADAKSLLLSGLAATSLPTYLTAVPSQYQPNLASLESAISALRGVASTGIPGAPVLGTNSAGSVITTGTLDALTTVVGGTTIVGVTGTGTNSVGSTITGITGTISTGGVATPTQPSGAIVTTDSAGSTITGLATVVTNSAGSSSTILTSTFSVSTPSGSSGASSSSTTTSSTSTTTTGTATSSTTVGSTTTASTTKTSGAANAALPPSVGGILGLVGFMLAL
ncbi:MAG: hypothetical protein M1838_000837 [Thelocarpon superellum]|nr:MAG: hypothetical protein M1838_000837 [Thelocarpon superellum]